MRLISSFKNRYNKITYSLYEFDNGLTFLHLLNPASIDADFAIVVRAGSAFEIEENVPRGTAHFLEHMLLNPNSTFTTKEDIDRYEQGNRYRPAIYTNAFTTNKNIYLTAHSNRKGINRIFKRMESEIEFPRDIFEKHMAKETGVILAERSRKAKKEKDGYIMSLEFLFKDTLPEFTGDILGEAEDIKNINIDHLERYFKERFVSGNTAFTLQTGEELSPATMKRLEKLALKFPKSKRKPFRDLSLKNEWKVGIFNEEKASGVSFTFLYFKDLPSKINYMDIAVENMSRRALDWVCYDILREQLALMYDFSTFKASHLSFQYGILGFRFTTEYEKAQRALEELYVLLDTKILEFLDSQKGKEWFDDVLSTYIYPRTVNFDPEIAQQSVNPVIEGDEIFNSNLFVKASKEVTREDLKAFMKQAIEIPPHIWIESDMKEDEVLNIVNNSSFCKRFNH